MSRRAQGQHPADFDPTACPILATHWFGIEPPRPTTLVTIDVIADLRRQRHIRKHHRLGPRVLDELLVEIGVERSITTVIERKVEAYAELEREIFEAAGSDEFWQPPLHEVE